MSAVAEVLDGAADLIERDGWCQRKFQDGTRRCASMAIYAATSARSGTAALFHAARDVFAHGLDAQMWEWNDAPGRTKAEVVAALRSAAERAA